MRVWCVYVSCPSPNLTLLLCPKPESFAHFIHPTRLCNTLSRPTASLNLASFFFTARSSRDTPPPSPAPGAKRGASNTLRIPRDPSGHGRPRSEAEAEAAPQEEEQVQNARYVALVVVFFFRLRLLEGTAEKDPAEKFYCSISGPMRRGEGPTGQKIETTLTCNTYSVRQLR